ncbi:MAG: SpvB/TcaC N-terminal domain-containing protein [Bacteroidales bacterium]|nr:SpvB/TcaC N-terminal domain-containing protein [Bacteroidales bacterium]
MITNNKVRFGIALLITVCLVVSLFSNRMPHDPKQTISSNSVSQGTIQPKGSNSQWRKSHFIKIRKIQPARFIIYFSSRKVGVIGTFGENHIDNPVDNIFTVYLDRQPVENDRIWLTYKLTGLDNNSNVSCSVNDRLSFGGCIVKKNFGTSFQRVELSAACFQKGENRIQFGLPEKADYGYKINDLSIEIERGASKMPLIVNTESTLYDGKAYIHGFVQNTKSKTSYVTVEGNPIALRDDEFETIIKVDDKHQVKVVAEIDGKIYTKDIQFKGNTQAYKSFALNDSINKDTKVFKKGKADILEIPNAQFSVNKDVLLSTKKLSITSLRDRDLPALDMGMVNVTDCNHGFRFLPHGEHFKNGATVSLKYDRTKIPDGYTENDIRTFYFDPKTSHWVALERDSVNTALCVVVSKTTHFTDMINGVIKAPESPETQGYTPTMMNDIKAADPASKIELIAPPTANNIGSANLTYNLEIPPARNGMSPKLAIQYNSDGGSAWLGEGWDLNVPSITVDTRWGVPRYDRAYETETYSMGGVMLATTFEDNYIRNGDTIFRAAEATIGHRAVEQSRISNRQFYPRIEGEFSRIIRKGSSPYNYIWEVTDKNGTKYTYGGTDAVLSGIVDGHDSLVIAEWKLKRVEEIHGDYIQYYYETDNEVISGNVKAKAIYLTRIEVGNANSIVPHTIIKFESDSLKAKKTNNARYGFLVSNYRLLNKITVDFENERLRSYTFNYKTGTFGSTLLEKVTHNDNNGVEFATHTFDYYNDAESKLFNDNEHLNVGRFEKVKYKCLTGLSDGNIYSDNGSALGATQTSSIGGSLYIGIGHGGLRDVTNLNTVGVNVGLSGSKTEGLSTLIDINGDGLPDYVYIKDNAMYFKAQKKNSNNSEPVFCDAIKINGVNKFEESSSTTISGGIESKAYCIAIGKDESKTFSKTKVYFLDVNNDGLVDIVNNGRVFFNTIKVNANGIAVPTFTISSRYTPNPISNSSRGFAEEYAKNIEYVSDNQSILFDRQTSLAEEQAAILDATPLQDIVRVWQAPYSGTIKIEGNVRQLLPSGNYDTTAYEYSDGVRAAIQVGAVEIWRKHINKGDGNEYQPDSVTNNISITKGQRVYFRVQSGDKKTSDGFFDKVIWNPVITYIDRTEWIDANGYSSNIFPSRESIVSKLGYNRIDTLLSTVRVRGLFRKPRTSDNINLKVFVSNDSLIFENSAYISNSNYQEQEVFNKFIYADSTYNGELSFAINNRLVQGKNFRFEVISGSNVRWDSIVWNPQIYYTIDGKDTAIYAGTKYCVFSKCVQEGEVEPYSHSGGELLVYPQRELPNSLLAILKGSNGFVRMAYIAPSCLDSLDFYNVPAGNYRLELYPWDEAPMTLSEPYKIKFGNSADEHEVQIFCKNDSLDFGPMWRNWGQFEYNADSTRCEYPIDESKLRLPKNTTETKLKMMAFFPMSPDIPTKTSWRGLNDYLTIKGDTVCCGRLNMSTMVDVFSAIDENGLLRSANCSNKKGSLVSANSSPNSVPYDEIVDAPILLTNSKSTCEYAASLVNTANGSSETTSSYMDMNGDGYPEKILKCEDKYLIHYTDARSWENGDLTTINNINNTSCNSFSFNLGGGVKSLQAISPTTTSSRLEGAAAEAATSSKLAQSQKKTQCVPSANVATNTDETNVNLCDMNGDGLPDKLYKQNDSLKVCFNLGYGFSDAIYLGNGSIQKGRSYSGNAGLGMGFNIGEGSFMGGIWHRSNPF